MLLYDTEHPGAVVLRRELFREKYIKHYGRTLLSTVGILLCAAATAVLLASFCLPMLQVYGSSMSPTLEEGDVLVSVKQQDFQSGDILAFYYGNKLLVKRYIAGAGDWVRIAEDGTVFVNDREIDEPYVREKMAGETDVQFPYQVPEGKIFVLGDCRSVSVDSRVSAIGCVSEEQIVGRIVFRLWPLRKVGRIH